MTAAVRDCLAAVDDDTVSHGQFLRLQIRLGKEELYQLIEAIHGIPSPHQAEEDRTRCEKPS